MGRGPGGGKTGRVGEQHVLRPLGWLRHPCPAQRVCRGSTLPSELAVCAFQMRRPGLLPPRPSERAPIGVHVQGCEPSLLHAVDEDPLSPPCLIIQPSLKKAGASSFRVQDGACGSGRCSSNKAIAAETLTMCLSQAGGGGGRAYVRVTAWAMDRGRAAEPRSTSVCAPWTLG